MMRASHLIGLLLWRGGLLLVAVYLFFTAAGYLLRFVDLPAQLEVGFGLAAAGMALIVISLIAERIQDRRVEGDLGE